MSLDPVSVAARLSAETGLLFSAESGVDDDGYQQISFVPADHERSETFAIRLTLLWRRLRVEFVLGQFAMPLLDQMATAGPDGRSTFRSVIADCIQKRAAVSMQVNGVRASASDDAIWSGAWQRFSLSLVRANIELGADEGQSDFEIASEWLLRFTAGILALMPLKPAEPAGSSDIQAGFPEGARDLVQVNRYERDRRNRAAALAIHGTRCRACSFDFGEHYGAVGAGYIEIHHVTPVSKLGPGYVIDPRTDLVPLCANCHRIAHRADPPLSVEDIAGLIRKTAKKALG